MSSFPRTNPPSDAAPAWRVILVGRTGLDQALRRDPGFELIRARDSLDALGELSDPIDESSPERAVVIVSPDAEPAGDEGGNFLSALRRIDAGVSVLRVGESRPGYDGAVSRDADADAVRKAVQRANAPTSLRLTTDEPEPPVRSEPKPAPRAPAPKPAPTAAPAPAAEPARPTPPPAPAPVVAEDPHERAIRGTPAAPTPPSPAPGDDAALVRALLAGRSVLEPALEIARQRAGRNDLHFHADSGRLTCDDTEWALGPGAVVFGSLSAWMNSWARLDAQHRELRQAAFTDPLTGAWNRRYFDRFMEAAIDQAKRARRSLTLMVFDIDNFKRYNDAYGHAAGDEILTETVRLLTSVIRPSDRVCRVGGDEFAVIFYEPQGPRQPDSAPPESIYSIATRFQRQICTHRFPKLSAEAAGTLTISGGLATFPWDGHDADALLERADQLSLESKKQGKNALTLGRGAEAVCHRPE